MVRWRWTEAKEKKIAAQAESAAYLLVPTTTNDNIGLGEISNTLDRCIVCANLRCHLLLSSFELPKSDCLVTSAREHGTSVSRKRCRKYRSFIGMAGYRVK